MHLFLLAVAFVLSGANQITNKALIELGLQRHANLYMLGFWGTGIVIGLIVRAVTRHPMRAKDAALGAFMGAAGAVGMITLISALKCASGVVVFPVRSCGNIALTAGLSYGIWREKLTVLQWLGIACAVAAICFLV